LKEREVEGCRGEGKKKGKREEICLNLKGKKTDARPLRSNKYHRKRFRVYGAGGN